MTIFNLIFAKCSVSQVAQKKFSGECMVVLKSDNVLKFVCGQILEAPHDLLKQIMDGPVVNRSHSRDKAFARVHIEFDVGKAGSVLTSVVLLFHQQVHFVQPVKWRAVLVNVVLKRLFEAEHGNATLVLNGVAHEQVKVTH